MTKFEWRVIDTWLAFRQWWAHRFPMSDRKVDRIFKKYGGD